MLRLVASLVAIAAASGCALPGPGEDCSGEACEELPDAGPPPLNLELTECEDTMIAYPGNSTVATWNYGAATKLRVASSDKLVLVRFPALDLHEGGTPVAARLTFSLLAPEASDVPVAVDQDVVQVQRLLEDWDEGTAVGTEGAANWLSRQFTIPWKDIGAGPNGSRSPVIAGTTTSGQPGRVTIELNPTEITPAANFGFVLSGGAGRTLASCEATDFGTRPVLAVDLIPADPAP